MRREELTSVRIAERGAAIADLGELLGERDLLVRQPRLAGDQLAPDVVIDGPAIVEEPTSTLVVNPGASARVSAGGRYIVTPPKEGQV